MDALLPIFAFRMEPVTYPNRPRFSYLYVVVALLPEPSVASVSTLKLSITLPLPSNVPAKGCSDVPMGVTSLPPRLLKLPSALSCTTLPSKETAPSTPEPSAVPLTRLAKPAKSAGLPKVNVSAAGLPVYHVYVG